MSDCDETQAVRVQLQLPAADIGGTVGHGQPPRQRVDESDTCKRGRLVWVDDGNGQARRLLML